MKKLILIAALLTSFSLKAQYVSSIEEKVIENEESYLLKSYLKYEKECYNDSSQKVTHVGSGNCYYISNSAGQSLCQQEYHFALKWIRRQPSFEGYINYLKQKLK